MIAIKGHFDGAVIVPDEPLHLQKDQALIIRLEPVNEDATPRGTPGPSLLRFAGAIPQEDLRAMSKAIEEDCERVGDEW
ncbi:MAG: hypothetical protein JWN24_301 [Phycisphaerales bacterium]|nr:hypothetical protein [Phycisphaerales bacterium]